MKKCSVKHFLKEAVQRSEKESKERGKNAKVFKYGILLDGFGLETPLVIPLRKPTPNMAEWLMGEIDILEVKNQISWTTMLLY